MSQHASALSGAACGETDGSWLPLIEYSIKSGVSLSTIRRKIKTNSIPFRLEKGRYLILFGKTSGLNSPAATPTAVTATAFPEPITEEEFPMLNRTASAAPPRTERNDRIDDERWAIPLIERSVKLVSDAFEKTLNEKDERIRLLEKRAHELEERVHELRTLVRVLEEKYEVRY